MKFEFAKCTEITELYKKHCDLLQDNDGYIKFYMCLDVNDFWILRVLENRNEEYEEEEGVYLIERCRVPKDSKRQGLSISKAIQLVKDDIFENWDVVEYNSLDAVIEVVDGGFGIN